MTKIKIVSGWTNPGGSSISFINLCNLFNENGHDCILFGPHEWHLNACKGSLYHSSMLSGRDGEVLLTHFMELKERPKGFDKVILVCHEKESWRVKDHPKHWDEIVYVSESQRDWQGVYGKVIPNVVPEYPWDFVWAGSPVSNAVGVIGGIEPNKQTHVSIERALEQGSHTILLYGVIQDYDYYRKHVEKYVKSGQAVLQGFCDDPLEMYRSVDKVYHSSKSETFNLVKAECMKMRIPYEGLPSSDTDANYDMSNTEILEEWEKCFKTIAG